MAKTAQRVLYLRTTVLNRQGLDFQGPAILVSNHPNTLMDPLGVATRTPRFTYFLANASLFKRAFPRWFFNTFYCIPIKRLREDAAMGDKISNDDSFARCNAHLMAGGALYMAPEGTSFVERRLRPMRTGAARIAFQAEAAAGFGLGLQVIPTGLNYEAPERFDSRLLVAVGQPIWVADFRAAYEQDPVQAVRQLTDAIGDGLRQVLIAPEDEEEDTLLRHLELLLETEVPDDAARFQVAHAALAGLRRYKAEEPAAWARLQQQAASYQQGLAAHGLSDAAIAQPQRRAHLLALLLGFPFFLHGWLHHLLAIAPPWLLARLALQRGLYIGYKTTVRALSGLVSFPLAYWLQFKIAAALFGPAVAWGYLLTLPLFGWAALLYRRYWQQQRAYYRQHRLAEGTRSELRRTREALLEWLQAYIG